MESQQIEFIKLINYPNSQFYIPVYQRKYSWTVIQCKKLYDDIVRLKKNSKSKHFLGTVIYKKDNLIGTDVSTLEIVDSQQRLTTTSIFLKALADYDKEIHNGEETDFYRKIYNQALINPYTKSITKTKLTLSQTDREVYNDLINNREIKDSNHLININYKYFYNRLKEERVNCDEIYTLMNRLMIIELSLGENDDAQETFESVNSTGLGMESADFIRNYIFLNLPIRLQEEIYYNYWSKIEGLFDNDSKSLTEFLRNYLSIKSKEIIKETDVYEKFKDKFNKEDLVIINSELDDMLKYAKAYKDIICENFEDDDIRKYISDFNKIDINPFKIILIKLIIDYKSKKLSKSDLIDIFKIILSYTIRRFFQGQPTNVYNKLSIALISQIREKDYKHSVERFLLTRQGNTKFIKDNEFLQGFISQPLYKKNKNIRNYVIYELENYNQNEKLNIDASELTIEHILPQNKKLSKEWISELGENWKEIQDKYGHSIGNLTITGYNSRMSDKVFCEKRDMKNGFKECPARLNDGLRELDHWNEEAIINRANDLFSKAKEIWDYPITDIEVGNSSALTINDNWVNKKINKVIFKEKEKDVSSVTDVYKFLIECFYLENPTEFISVLNETGFGGKSFVSYESESLKHHYFELKNTGIYIGTKYNSQMKNEYLKRLILLLNINEEDIEIFEVKN